MRKKRPNKPDIVKVPERWADNFKAATMRRNFQLHLSQGMLEFLCATADGVMWDRSLYSSVHFSDNYIGMGRCLERRGLVEHKGQSDPRSLDEIEQTPRGHYAYYRLTPAGAAVVDLLRVAGMFIDSDASIEKRIGRKRG